MACRIPAWAMRANALSIRTASVCLSGCCIMPVKTGSSLMDAGAAKDEPVAAVANGLVTWRQDIGSEGWVIVIEHLLANGSKVWSAYWHVADPTIAIGQLVYRGDVIGQVADRGDNSHLHWEIRTWKDGSNLFPPASAGGRGTCNGRAQALGYTWDDQLGRASPNAWGYLDPVKFIRTHP